MTKFGVISIILLFLTNPSFVWGQDQDSIWYEERAEELYRKGIQIYRNGNDIESIDTLELALKYSIQSHGDENYELGKVYSALGIISRSLNRNNKALSYFKLAEKNYQLNEELNPSNLAGLYVNICNVYLSKLD